MRVGGVTARLIGSITRCTQKERHHGSGARLLSFIPSFALLPHSSTRGPEPELL
jgi:hypothetical protein